MRKHLRAWNVSVETYFLEVILSKRRGKTAAVVRALLLLSSKLYQVLVKVHGRPQ